MLQRKTKALRIAVAALGVVFVLLLVGLAESYYERFQAQNLISILSDIQVGATTESHAKEATKQFSYFNQHPNGSVISNTKVTSDYFIFENRAYWWLHLAPPKRTEISIDYADGIVRSKTASYYEGPGYGGVINEELQHTGTNRDLIRAEAGGRYAACNHGIPIRNCTAECYQIVVHEDVTVPLARRRLDWQIDLSCMTSIGGCRDVRKIMRGAMR